MKTNTKEALTSKRPPQEARYKMGGLNNRVSPIVFLLSRVIKLFPQQIIDFLYRKVGEKSYYEERNTKKKSCLRIPTIFLSSVLFSFLISLLITIFLLSQKAYATEIKVEGLEELDFSWLAELLGRIFFLFILFVVTRYCAKIVGINFPECILPKKQVKGKDGNTYIFGRGGFFDFIRYTIYYFFNYIWKAIYYITILPFVFIIRKIWQRHRPQGFMNIAKRIWLINPFRKGLLLNGLWDRISQKASFNHNIVVARIGGGKSSSFIIPNILKLNNCSILCTDLSGELHEKTSGYMARKGYDIKIINPAKLDISNRYNPLASVSTYKEILDVSAILINAGDPNPKDPFWNNGAKKLLEILITALVNQREIRSAKNIQDYDKYCNLANLKFLLNSFGRDTHCLERFIEKYSVDKNGVLQNNYKEWRGFTSGNKKTTQSFLTTAQTALRIMGNDDIAKLTASNEIDLHQIRKKKTIIYLQIPQEDLSVYGFLLNLFYSRFFATCFKSRDEKTLPVYCLLDEAGHTNIPSLATTITTIRKYRVSISLILQSLSQLETAYGISQANTIINGGVANQIYFSGLDLDTCQRLEKIMGTVITEETDEKGNKRTTNKPLMDTQSIMRMRDKQAIYLYSNQKPTLLRLKPYFKHPVLNQYSKIPEFIPNFYHRVDNVSYLNFED